MENISDLIKEAKPLYFQKKRQKIQAMAIMGVFLFMIPVFEINNSIQQDKLLTQSDSILSYQGLPTDEYGLLEVE